MPNRLFRVSLFSVALMLSACSKKETPSPSPVPAPSAKQKDAPGPAPAPAAAAAAPATPAAATKGAPPDIVPPGAALPPAKKTPSAKARPAPKPLDPIFEGKVTGHRATLSSLEQELATQLENLNRSLAKEDSIEKDIEQLIVIKAKLEGVVATLDENVKKAMAAETDLTARKIEAVLLKAYGHEIVVKLREVRSELYEARLLVEPEKTPDFLEDILNDDPKERRANRRRNYIRHMEIAEEIYSDILELIRKNKLEKKLFFGALTKEAFFGTYDGSYSKLSRTESLSSHFFIRTELQSSLGEEFTRTLTAPWFFKETDEYNSYRTRAQSWTGKVAKLKELLQIEKPLSDVNEALDLIPAAAETK